MMKLAFSFVVFSDIIVLFAIYNNTTNRVILFFARHLVLFNPTIMTGH